MTEEQIEQMLKEYIVQEFLYDEPEVVLTNELKIIEQGIVDSLDLFNLVRFIEEEVGIFWEPHELVQKNFETIGRIKSVVLEKLAS